MKVMKSLYISLVVLIALLLVIVSYGNLKFQGLAIKDTPFNLEVEIPSVYNSVNEGSEIHFTTKIFNLGGENRMDVSLRYRIIGEDGDVVASKTETMAIETQASFVGTMKIPEDIAEGTYTLDVTLLVDGAEEARSEGSFEIVAHKDNTKYYTYIVVISIVLLALFVYLASKSKIILEKFRLKSKIHSMVKKRLGN